MAPGIAVPGPGEVDPQPRLQLGDRVRRVACAYARAAHYASEEAFALLMELGAEEHLEDFKYLFASGREGYATTDPEIPLAWWLPRPMARSAPVRLMSLGAYSAST